MSAHRGSVSVVDATYSADGRCDVSPKGDPPGFVRVLSPARIALPERPGNRRMDGFHNVLENPHAGLVCIIPGRGDTLRINGRARIVTNLPDFDAMVVGRHRPAPRSGDRRGGGVLPLPQGLPPVPHVAAGVLGAQRARPYPDIALALWRKGEPGREVRRHYATALECEDLYPSETSDEDQQ